jgi:hypothetical protein
VRVTEVSFKDRRATVVWEPAASATAYDVLLGRDQGLRDLGALTVEGTTTYTLQNVPIGVMNPRPFLSAVWVTILSRNGDNVNPRGPSAPLIMADHKGLIDALFFSRGDYIGASRSVSERDVAWGWPRGSQVLVRVSSSFPQQARERIRTMLDQVNDSLGGTLRATLDDGASIIVPRGFPPFRRGEIVVAQQPDEVVQATCLNEFERKEPHRGCTISEFSSSGVLRAAVAVVTDALDAFSTTYVPSHEIAHALLGFAHLGISPPYQLGRQDGFSWFKYPVMGLGLGGIGSTVVGTLAPYELDAVQSVYDAGLGGGSRRSDFVARGLVNP